MCKKTTDLLINEGGLALSTLYDGGYGTQVQNAREKDKAFSEELLEASAQAIMQYWQTLPDVIVPIPSLRRPNLVPHFAQQLARKLKLPILIALEHIKQHPPQAEFHNSFQQANNVMDKFKVVQSVQNKSVLLVDDVTDSGWTLTVLGDLLQKHRAKAVYPFTIATTNTSS